MSRTDEADTLPTSERRPGGGARPTPIRVAAELYEQGGLRLSLRSRLNLMIGLTMLPILGLGFLFAVYSARQSVAEEVISTVNLAIQLIEAGLAEHRYNERPVSAWLPQLDHLDRTRHLRIRIDQSPATLADRGVQDREKSYHAPRWFVWAVSPEPVIADKRLTIDGEPDISIRIEAQAGDEIDEAWLETRGFLTLILVLAGAIYLVVHVSVGRASLSVGIILEGLEEVEKGDYGTRLPGFQLPEFDRISQAFNDMAQTLENARRENRTLTQQSLTIQEEERRYLARELHDELGQSLTAIKVMAASLRHADKSSQEAVEQIMIICDRLFGVLRGMMRKLRPAMLDELGLSASLEDLIENWRAGHLGITWSLKCEENVDECAGAVRIHLFRIVQECLTNIVRHSGARQATVRLALELRPEMRIRLEVEDDGCGFDPSQSRNGLGLPGMRERVESLGGRFALQTAPGHGVAINVTVPCGGLKR